MSRDQAMQIRTIPIAALSIALSLMAAKLSRHPSGRAAVSFRAQAGEDHESSYL